MAKNMLQTDIHQTGTSRQRHIQDNLLDLAFLQSIISPYDLHSRIRNRISQCGRPLKGWWHRRRPADCPHWSGRGSGSRALSADREQHPIGMGFDDPTPGIGFSQHQTILSTILYLKPTRTILPNGANSIFHSSTRYRTSHHPPDSDSPISISSSDLLPKQTSFIFP